MKPDDPATPFLNIYPSEKCNTFTKKHVQEYSNVK